MPEPVISFISGTVLPKLWKQLGKLRAERKELWGGSPVG